MVVIIKTLLKPIQILILIHQKNIVETKFISWKLYFRDCEFLKDISRISICPISATVHERTKPNACTI